MKKIFVILVLLSSLLFVYSSCKDDNEKLQEGHYSISIIGKDYCNSNNPSDYLYDAIIELSKIGDDTYEVYQKYYNSSGQENISPKSTITIYDGNKIKGKIYTNDLIWREGTITGTTDGEKIEGLFDGLITCYHDNTAQIKGTFTMKHEVWYPK